MSNAEPNAPTEAKVYSATIGAFSGTVVSGFLLWLIGCLWFGGVWTSDAADAAILAVPAPLSGIVAAVITVGLTYFGGWIAKHTPRSDAAAFPPSALRRLPQLEGYHGDDRDPDLPDPMMH